MNTGNNYAEYGTTQKTEGKFLVRKICLIVLYIAVFCLIIINPEMALMLGAIAVLLDAILIFFTWKYTAPDYKYVIESASIRFYRAYGKKSKLLFETKVKEIDVIAPYTDEYNAPAKASDIQATYDFRGTTKTPDAYFAIFNVDGKKTLVLFEATNKAVKLFAYYNKEHTVVRDDLRH